MQRQVRQLSLAALVVAGAFAACTKETPSKSAPPAAEAPSGSKPFAAALTVGPAPYAAAQPGVVIATVEAKDGFHVNADYPVAFKVDAASTVKFAGDRVPLNEGKKTPCAAHAEDACKVDFEVPLTAGAAGTNTVAGTLAFSVCSADKCLIEKVPLTLALDVK